MLLVAIGIASIVSFVTTIWSLVIIFKRSILGGLLSLFFGLPILYYLVTGWGKEGEDIKLPFFLNIVCWVVVGAVAFTTAPKMVNEADLRQSQEPASRSSPRFREPTPASESARFRETSNAQPAPAPRSTVQRSETAREAPKRQRAAHTDCVYKPVMTDEDMAKCR